MRRPKHPETIALACSALLLFAAYALLLLLPGESFGKVGKVETITINAWRGPLYLIALAISAVAVFTAIWAVRRQGRRWAGWALLVLGLGSPLLCCSGWIDDILVHQDAGSVRDRDGEEYHLLKHAFLQGAHLAIVRLRRRFGPMEEYEVLVESPWEASFGCLSVVRPEGSADEGLYLAKDRALVGVPYKNTAFLAYDLKDGKAYSEVSTLNERGYVDVRGMSPFLLLDEDDVPREADFKTLLDRENLGRPSAVAVEGDLSHPNPKVAAMARRFMHDLNASRKKR